MTVQENGFPPAALEGEDLATTDWDDARHWLGVYADLLAFKHRLLDQVRSELSNVNPEGRRAAAQDLQMIERQKVGYEVRLDLWYERVFELQGLYVNRETQVLLYRGREAKLPRRELQLLKFLLEHPHRFHTAEQITSKAWGDASLFPAEVRNYVSKTRKILNRLEIPCELVNRHGQGYSLIFNAGARDAEAGVSTAT